METIYGENWGLTLAISAILTWGIGLAPPLLLRFVFFRRPFEKWWAIGTVSVFWLFNMVLFISLGSKSKTHAALVLVALVSFYILRKEPKEKLPSEEKIIPPDFTKPEPDILKPENEKYSLRRRLLLAWGALTLLWGGFILAISWEDIAPPFLEIDFVIIETELDSNTPNLSGLLALEHSNKERKSPLFIDFQVKKLEPDTAELTAARKYYPSFKDRSDAQFSDHLWKLVYNDVALIRSRQIKRAKSKAWEAIGALTVPPVTVLGLGFLVGWIIRKYPPDSLTPYTKKIIAMSYERIWCLNI